MDFNPGNGSGKRTPQTEEVHEQRMKVEKFKTLGKAMAVHTAGMKATWSGGVESETHRDARRKIFIN